MANVMKAVGAVGKGVGAAGNAALKAGAAVQVGAQILENEKLMAQLKVVGAAAVEAAQKGAAAVNRLRPGYLDLQQAYAAIATTVERIPQSIEDVAAKDPAAPVEDWTDRLQKITIAIPLAHAAIGGAEMKQVKQIRKDAQALQDEIFRYTMGQAPKAKPRIALPKLGRRG